MTAAKHTAGPWRACRDHTVVSKKALIADCRANDSITVEEAAANARLIAASPELLEALDTLVRSVEWIGGEYSNELSEEIRTARAAIAKAEGGAA